MHPAFFLMVATALTGQTATPGPNAAPAAPPALASHLGMEIDDLDHEIRRQRGALQVARARQASTQRALQRGTASRGELEQVNADLRSLEAREAEASAFRALKVYESDVLKKVIEPDEEKAHNLVLDLLRKQEAMAQVEVDFQGYRLKQEEALLARGVITRPHRDGAAIDYDTARLHLALSQARQAQLALEYALRANAGPPDAATLVRLKTAYLQARVRYYEIGATIARSRLELARDQIRRDRMTQGEFDYYQDAYDTAADTLAAERKRLGDPEAPTPQSFPRAG